MAIDLTAAGTIPGHLITCLSPCRDLNVRLLDFAMSGISVMVFTKSVVSCHRLESNLNTRSWFWDRYPISVLDSASPTAVWVRRVNSNLVRSLLFARSSLLF